MLRSSSLLATAVLFASQWALAQSASPAILIGPDIAGAKGPVVIDTLGEHETLIRAMSVAPPNAKQSARWSVHLEISLMLPAIASDDVLEYQVLKGKKKLGKPFRCNPKHIVQEHDLAYFECDGPGNRGWDEAFSTSGVHTVELSYKKPVEGQTFDKFARLEVDAVQLKQGASNNPTPAWGTNHDMKLAITTIEEKVNNAGNGWEGAAQNALQAATRKGIPYLLLHTWFKTGDRLPRLKATCLFDGKRIAEADSVGGHKFDYWSYKRKGSPDRDKPSWVQAEFFLYSLHPRPDAEGNKGSWAKPQHWMNENPGDYKCVITGDGDVVKEVHFKVGADGEVVREPCQAQSVNSLSTVTLVRTMDKKLSDTGYDKNAGKKSAFQGRVKWAKGCPLNR